MAAVSAAGEHKMQKWFEIAAAVFAFAAAGFWFASAYGKVPEMLTYWGSTPESDPFFQSIKFSTQMNRYAAALSGLSALCMSAGLFARLRRR
jgi:hypothetical protein